MVECPGTTTRLHLHRAIHRGTRHDKLRTIARVPEGGADVTGTHHLNPSVSRRNFVPALTAVGIAAHAAIGVAAAAFIATRKSTAAQINEWLAAPVAGGIHQLSGSLLIDEPLIIPSDRFLDASRATITLAAGSDSNILVNAQARTPQRIVRNTRTTAGSSAIVSETAAFTSSDIGRTLVVPGAGGNGHGPLTAVILSVQSSTTVVLSEPASATVSDASANVFERDRNITIRGGVWDRGINGGDGNDRHGLMFRHVDNLDVEIDRYTSAGGGKYAIAAGDVRDYRLALRDAQTTSDGIHVTGPALRGSIPFVAGTTGDDMLAFTCGDYPAYADVSGDIIGVSIGELRPRGAMQALKVLAGAGRRIDALAVHGVIQGKVTDHAVWIGDGYGYGESVIGGQYGSVDVGTIEVEVGGAQFSDLYLVCPAALRITAKIRHPPLSPGNVSVSVWGTSTAAIKQLVLNDCDWAAESLAQAILVSSSTATVEHLTVNRPRHVGAGSLFAITNGSVVNLIVREGDWEVTGGDGAIFVNGGEVSSITVQNCTGIYSTNGYALRINNGSVTAIAFREGAHSSLHTLVRSFTAFSCSIALDHCTIASASRIAQLIGAGTIILFDPTFDSIKAPAFHVTNGPLSIEGSARIVGDFTLLETTGDAHVRVIGPIAKS